MITLNSNIPILIIGYQRVNSLELIINTCLKETTSTIFISMDGPPDSDPELIAQARLLVADFKSAYPDRISLKLLSKNVGVGVNVITALDWFFSINNCGVVLEDDCIPHRDFFKYALSAVEFVKTQDSVWFFSGFRPPITEIEEIQYALCSIPLNWGWGTTSEKWMEIRNLIIDYKFENLFLSFLLGSSRVYWNIGYRRILKGWVDSWDTALAFLMIKKNKFTLIPNCNLISNIGNDEFALNTKLETLYLNSPVFSWDGKDISVKYEGSCKVNSAIYKKMIGIRKIHRVLPIVKYTFQKIFRFHDTRGSLAHRLVEFYNREITINE
jgi:hypothetical protein